MPRKPESMDLSPLAMEDHYKPQGPSDSVPCDPVAAVVALADKVDMLAGFWLIDEKPTGSKDPFALRRAALGIIRIILENDLRLHLLEVFSAATDGFEKIDVPNKDDVEASLLTFLHDRLKVYLRDKGARHDLIDAVISSKSDDLQIVVRKVEALGAFLKTTDGENLLGGYKRAANILSAEEKKGTAVSGHVADDLLAVTEEKDLFAAVKKHTGTCLKSTR